MAAQSASSSDTAGTQRMTSQAQRADDGLALGVAAAAAVTILDGFDAFSFSLMAPKLAAELGLPSATLGSIFAAGMGGMILGGIFGGWLGDRVGRLRVLLVAFALFGVAGLTMPMVQSVRDIILNRLVAGVGLGAAAPLAVGLLNSRREAPVSALAISLVWAGIPLGGSLAALFNYLVVASQGWRSIFVVGGLLPLPVALFAYAVFRGSDRREADTKSAPRAQIADIFRDGRALPTLALAAMFFFGYITTAIIVNWLPTILVHRDAGPGMISATFSAINAGGMLGVVCLGYVAGRRGLSRLLAAVWLAAGGCGLVAAAAAIATPTLAALGVIGATLGSGAQGLAVARANEMHRSLGLQTTTIGLMTGLGRIGQFTALSLSGVILSVGFREETVFALAGISACLAAAFALIGTRRSPA